MRDKGYRRHQYFKHKEEQRKLLERYEPRSLNVNYRVAGSYLRGESGRAAFIDEQAAKRSRTPKPCSCYLCSVSTKCDGYKYSDKQRIEYMENTELAVNKTEETEEINDDEVIPITLNQSFNKEVERKRIREFLNNPYYKDDWDD